MNSPEQARYAEKCAAKFPEAKADGEKYASSGNFTRSMKCVYACIFQESGKMTSDGIMSIDKDLDPRVPADVREILRPCYNSEPSSDVCEVAFQWLKCVREKESVLQARQSAEEKLKQEKDAERAHSVQKLSNTL